jgi:anti-anti-sigma factor
MADKLYFDVRYNAGTIYASANGNLGFFTAPDLKNRLAAWIEPGVEAIHIDLKAIPHLDSAGIAALLQAVRTCSEREVELKLLGVPLALKTIFEKSGLAHTLG